MADIKGYICAHTAYFGASGGLQKLGANFTNTRSLETLTIDLEGSHRTLNRGKFIL